MVSVITAFVVAFICFILGLIYLLAATNGGRREQLPSHAKFNPLNVLLYPYTLTEKGRKLRSWGLRFLAIFFAISLAMIILGLATDIIRSAFAR
jgi:hypothetical protein